VNGELMFEYTGSGLAGIYLKNGYTIVETAYGKGVTIQDVEGLHRAIAADIVQQRRPMTGHQFRFLRKEKDLVQEEAAALFRVDVQTIANWEKKGADLVPGASDIAMRAWYSAYVHATYGPVKIEPGTPPAEGATFELLRNCWAEAHAA
jgi:DNA-binding transcriptional regulator YiaG